MRNLFAVSILASAAFAGGCTTAGTGPATTPPLPGPTTQPSSLPPPSTIPPPTTPSVGSTTVIDRVAEIQTIFEDLERRRLQAIYDQDEEAFRALFVVSPYLEQSMSAFRTSLVGRPLELRITILEILRDSNNCLAFMSSTTVVGEQREAIDTTTLQRFDGSWAYAFVESGRGDWLCDGPHPLSR